MFSSFSLSIIHSLTGILLEPVIWSLVFLIFLAVYESAIALGERFGGLAKLVSKQNASQLLALGKRRIERADFITRLSPVLGLMGTLIPLGPGLAALGEGELQVLTTAITIAFDTTVIGLLAGLVGFVLGRLRRRWYDEALTIIQEKGNG
ncbi:MAG: MotA/TolQ/ExbB proton channel family protein [Oleiphilus sp.]